jgi:hypothetical protein
MCYVCKKQKSCKRRQGESVEKLNLVLQYLIEKVDYLEDLIDELHDEEDIETVTFSDRDSCGSRKSDSECESDEDDECSKNGSSSQDKNCRRGECDDESTSRKRQNRSPRNGRPSQDRASQNNGCHCDRRNDKDD